MAGTKTSQQDRTYLGVEADAFYERNLRAHDPKVLRPGKRAIAEHIERAGVRPKRVLEYGCTHGDLLNHYAGTGAECFGVEPSAQAVERGNASYGNAVQLLQGTIADNPLVRDPKTSGSFDLVIVEDVLCWVGRETLFQSIANIDDALCDGGFFFLREFLPLSNKRNRNHHLPDEEIYCYKPAGPHAAIFTASGIYEVVWRQVWFDRDDAFVERSGGDAFESRWCDSILRKSYSDYYG